MGGDSGRQALPVIAAFEHRDNAAAAATVGDFAQLAA